MPGLGTRNMSRSVTSFATKLVADSACEPKVRKQREAELTAALKAFATMYQKLTNSVNGADWHVHFVKVLKDNMSPANVNSTAMVNSNAMVNGTVNPNNAVNAANVNGMAMVNSNAANTANVNNVNNNNNTTTTTTTTNNSNKRPAEAMNQDGNNDDASNARKRAKTEDALETTFKVVTHFANTGYTAQVYHHGGNKSHEFALTGPSIVHVYTGAGTPAFAQPIVPAQAATPATSTSANAQANGDGDPSARPVPLDMYL